MVSVRGVPEALLRDSRLQREHHLLEDRLRAQLQAQRVPVHGPRNALVSERGSGGADTSDLLPQQQGGSIFAWTNLANITLLYTVSGLQGWILNQNVEYMWLFDWISTQVRGEGLLLHVRVGRLHRRRGRLHGAPLGPQRHQLLRRTEELLEDQGQEVDFRPQMTIRSNNIKWSNTKPEGCSSLTNALYFCPHCVFANN